MGALSDGQGTGEVFEKGYIDLQSNWGGVGITGSTKEGGENQGRTIT